MFDGFVKSPSAALCIIFSHCGVPLSTPCFNPPGFVVDLSANFCGGPKDLRALSRLAGELFSNPS